MGLSDDTTVIKIEWGRTDGNSQKQGVSVTECRSLGFNFHNKYHKFLFPGIPFICHNIIAMTVKDKVSYVSILLCFENVWLNHEIQQNILFQQIYSS